ncbi:protein CapI [Candidatus Peribacteria bacterium RIFCSPHIGHO2_01_FULL_51_9]|nr:MAG: protein CapI [Candidatus Peribacteria bacterium RIFCSPHIGHO2_01_FULL_51_9]
MKILLTGSAGFIGFHTAKTLLERGDTVIGFDNFCPYYDATLKENRNKMLEAYPNFTLLRGNLENVDALTKAFDLLGSGPDSRICHLAAQAGVRHSIEHPEEFIQSNIVGFANVIELAKKREIPGFVYASSSSVYGNNTNETFSEKDRTDNQVSLYGMTKKSNELHASVYHNLFGMHCTGLRFFTVYGPWGRPDMALFIFTKAVLSGALLPIFGQGKMFRDFTYVDDIVAGIIASLDKNHPNEVFNLGAGHTEKLMSYVEAVEKACGKEGKKEFFPMQQGDVVKTSADITKARKMIGFQPKTRIADGVPRFVEWYREYYKL